MKTEQQTHSSEWMQKVKDNATVLRQLVADYHPSSQSFPQHNNLEITAPNAELACKVARASIQREEPQNPLDRWDRAVKEENIGEISSLLSGAWFGVPESTSCWRIPGFAVACDLLDDPPEMIEENA